MRAVKSEGTRPEKTLSEILKDMGVPYRTQVRDLPGSPDAFASEYGVALFVHGCFWHGHLGCRRSSLPKSHRRFWSSKIASNQRRDATAARKLRRKGYHVVTIWACQLKNRERIRNRISLALTRAT
jgi:DNA mismatch endonuclease Vsr